MDSRNRGITPLAAVERRFAPRTRIALLLGGLSGGYLLWNTGLWHVLDQPAFWWLGAMIGYWLIFALLVFVIEPLGIIQRQVFAAENPARSWGWRRFHAMHRVLLGLAIVVVAATPAHGF